MVTMAEFMEERSGQKVDVDMLIKMLDKNGNDVIELDELKEMVQRMVPKWAPHKTYSTFLPKLRK